MISRSTMSQQLNEHETRIRRLQQLRNAGVIPYAQSFAKSHTCADLIALGET